MSDDLEYRIGKLDVKPGDMLVVKLNSRLTDDMAKRARQHFETSIPGVKVLVIDSAVDLSILTFEEIQRRAAA